MHVQNLDLCGQTLKPGFWPFQAPPEIAKHSARLWVVEFSEQHCFVASLQAPTKFSGSPEPHGREPQRQLFWVLNFMETFVFRWHSRTGMNNSRGPPVLISSACVWQSLSYCRLSTLLWLMCLQLMRDRLSRRILFLSWKTSTSTCRSTRSPPQVSFTVQYFRPKVTDFCQTLWVYSVDPEACLACSSKTSQLFVLTLWPF